jgi:gliding motility-associated-like protein
VDLAGCTASDAVTVTVLTATAVDLGPDQTICSGDQVVLNATTPGATYAWSTGAATPTITVTTAGTFWVQVSQAGCSASDTVVVAVLPSPAVDLGPDQTLCDGQSLVLDATTPGATYAWSTGALSPTITVDASGTYSVTVDLAGCTASDAVTVTVLTATAVDLGPDQTICSGDQVVLNATTPGATYAWSTGAATPTITVTTAGTFWVQVSQAGCSASDTVVVAVLPSPVVDLGPDQTLCDGQSLVLDATTPGATYAWSTGAVSPTITVDASGTYSVTVDLAGCTASDAVTVTMIAAEDLDLGPNIDLCPGTSATLDASLPGGQYLWNTGHNGPTIQVSAAGTYWVTVAFAGCSVSDTVSVAEVPLPQPDLGPDRSTCADQPITLSVAPGGAAVLWSTGSTANSITAQNSGVYSVTLSLEGCTASDAVQIVVVPVITEIGLDATAEWCPGDALMLDASLPVAATYAWSTGASAPWIPVDRPGTFTVVASGECVDATATVVVEEGQCGVEVHVPNAFTPNGDGINDLFGAVVDGPVDRFRLNVFDRWGELIFTANDPLVRWDGNVGGGPAPDGVYIWDLEFRSSTSAQGRRRGHVTLLR